ncbi:MAG: ABC transporter ATP-binding protein [Christensenellales bacterium]
MENKKYILELKNINKYYDDKRVVNNANLKIEKGQFVTLLGPSGCGKTTTLRMIAGFEQPTEGQVLFDGEDITSLPPHKREVNTVFQKYALFPHLNVFKNIAFGLKMKKVEVEYVNRKGEKATKLVNLKRKPVEQEIVGKNGEKTVKIVPFCRQYKMVTTKDRKGNVTTKKVNCYKAFIEEKVRRALKIVGLSDYENRDVNSLSGGQQQRVAIARAIVNEPKILLLDEPLGALDLKMRQEMQLELKSMHQKLGITFIYVTHDQEEALTMSDTIVVMRDGKICQEGSPIDIYNEPKTAYVADFIGESNILDGVMPEDKKVIFAGVQWDCVDVGFEPNQKVDIVVRPEDWEVREKGKGILDGKIVSSIFKGVHYEMSCIAGGYEFIIHNTVERPIGSEVSLYVDPDNIHIMTKELYANDKQVEFLSNTTLDLYGGTYDFTPTALFSNCTYDSENDILTIDGEETTLKGKKAVVRFEFTDVEMTDDEMDAPLAANVESMIYKGKNYIVCLRTDNNHHIFADTEYLWDDGDRVGIAVKPDRFKFIRMIEE